MKKKIFIVDDEIDIQNIIEVSLKKEGYDTFTFSSAEEASESLSKNTPDLIILDIMMEGMDGYEFCRKLRSSDKFSDIPVIFLSAKSDEFDRVLELGGDDYMAKPFSIKELRSRVKAVLRRTSKKSSSADTAKKIQYKGIEIYPEQYRLSVDSKDIKLTKTEFEILHLFLKNPEKIFTRDNIIDSIRGNDVYVIDRTIDVHIMNIRKKIGPYKNVITTFSGVGYGFKE